MRCYRVRWKNGEVEIVFAESDEDLFFALDEVGSPYEAIIEEIEPPNGVRISPRNWKSAVTDILADSKVIRRITKSDLDRAFDVLYGGLPVMLH